MTAGSPATAMPAIVTDYDAITSKADLTSELTLRAGPVGTTLADHTLSSLRLATATMSMSYDLVAAGLPVLAQVDIEVAPTPGDPNGRIDIGSHGFTLGLPLFWQQALEQLAITPRFPLITPPTTRNLLGAMVAVAQSGGMIGCAAVEHLVCTVTGAASCTGVVDPACTAGLDLVTAALDADFLPPTTIDFQIAGSAEPVDSDGDLIVDSLSQGLFVSGITTTAPFQGTRLP